MEKRKAHYNLMELKKLIEQGNYSITKIARNNAIIDFSYSEVQVLELIKELELNNLYKSMTVNNNNQLWQDVYHKQINLKQTAYIKLQIINENTVIIQFKEK